MPWSPTDIVGTELVFFGDDGGYGVENLLRSTAGVIGKGVFGMSYKSELQGKNAVAVKRLKVGCLPEEEFKEKVELGKAVHENLLPLRGNEGKSKVSITWELGVLLLELLTDKAPLDAFTKNKGVDLPKWIRSMFQEKLIIDVFDNMLPKHDQNNAEQMVQLLQLAVCCTFKYPNKRPSMAAVTNQIRDTCRFH
ncbi:hypothetical protein K7X08_029502 [Anisodus acutangulus]|uniref:Protein kinase domain-containing protein n=1 Tax=Anisodus acutangulus TaxID=402998 RepID=A0A9Q1L471_9SOLA|nr:hypothetical protein K7X08_029502 [Anisodus acutangulus]